MTLTVVKTAPSAKEPDVQRTPAEPTGEELRIGEMLSYRRPHDSQGEAEFIERFILPLGPDKIVDDVDIQAFVVCIPPPSGARITTAFCAHTDSVHNRQIPDVRQKIGFDGSRREFYVNDMLQRDCLGADDAAGCYVLIRMIEANVPGMYVFFRGEERGGIGSSYVTERCPDLFNGIERAIQFDRRGTQSIITEMMCGRTCSDEFAEALAKALDMGHRIDPTGSFTDTANLAEIVPECTNVSVGYEDEHSSRETLDTRYLIKLAERCIDAFSDSGLELPTKRLPGEFGLRTDPLDYWYGNRTSTYTREREGGYAAEFGTEVSAYDLPEMTKLDLHDLVASMSNSELVDLLYEAGEALAEAYAGHYTSSQP